ncbi:succinylglutamate desuccinylase/aspartoacylase [gamma proteobacterium NOR5-3]|nr:succinylglutamate desuccinylase/aspartoacylase [gamma proteobacterium NOR5-3]
MGITTIAVRALTLWAMILAATGTAAQEIPQSSSEPLPGSDSKTAASDAEGHSTPKAKPAKNVDLKDVIEDPAQLSAVPASTPVTPVADKDATTAPNTPLIPEASTQPALSETSSARDDASITVPASPATQTKRQLILLGAEVLPGTTTRLAWTPSVSFLGISAPTSVLVVNGVKPGPNVCLTAAVHGDEINGIETVRRVLYNIDADTLSGAVIGVPIVNLQGFRAGSRYLADRRDLNRFFPGNPQGSAASRIAFSFFEEIIRHCDMLIDLHTGSFRRTNLPQLRADLSYPAIQDLAQTMGRIVVLQSKGAKGSLRRAASEAGIPTVTLEAGAPNELNKNAVEDSVKSIRAAFAGLGLTGPRKSPKRSNAPVYYQSTWIRASEGGILISEAKLGATVKRGDVLGAVTNPITNERSEIVSPSNGRIIGMALNQVMHPGFAAYHLGIDPTADVLIYPDRSIEAQDALLLAPADDEDPDNDQNVPLTDEPDAEEATGLIRTDLLEDDESGR